MALQAAPAPGSHLVLPAVASLLSRHKRREEAAFAAVEAWHRCPCLVSSYHRSCWVTSKTLRWVHLSLWAGVGQCLYVPGSPCSVTRGNSQFSLCPLCVPSKGWAWPQLLLQDSTIESTSPVPGAASCLSASGLHRFLVLGPIKVGKN